MLSHGVHSESHADQSPAGSPTRKKSRARTTFGGAKPITEMGGSARSDEHSPGRDRRLVITDHDGCQGGVPAKLRTPQHAAPAATWLTYAQAASYTGWSVGHLRNLVSAGQIPVYGRPRPPVPPGYVRPLSDEPGHGDAEVPGRKERTAWPLESEPTHGNTTSSSKATGASEGRLPHQGRGARSRTTGARRLDSGRKRIQFADAYEQYLSATTMKDRSRDSYANLWPQIQPVLGHLFIEEVDTSAMDALKRALPSRLGPKSVNNRLGLVRAVLRFCWKRGLLAAVPYVPTERTPKKPPKWYSEPSETGSWPGCSSSNREWYLFFYLSARLGLRACGGLRHRAEPPSGHPTPADHRSGGPARHQRPARHAGHAKEQRGVLTRR